MGAFALISELKKCEYILSYGVSLHDMKYNGIFYNEGGDVYVRVLNELLIEFKQEFMSMSSIERRAISAEVENLKKVYFDVPSDNCIDEMKSEYKRSRNASLKQEIDFSIFLREMVEVQKSYISELNEWVSSFFELPQKGTKTEEVIVEKTNVENEEKCLGDIAGVRKLAEFLGVGTNTAQKIITSEVLSRYGVQYRVSKRWYFKRKELEKLLVEKPNLLKEL